MGSVGEITDERQAAEHEAALVAAAREDPAAFGVLYQAYLPRVYRFPRARATTDAEAADLTQEVFVRALAAILRYRERGLPFAAWLFRIARNVATDAARRRRPTVSWEHVPEPEHPAHPADPARAALDREAMERLRALIAALDEEKRDLLALRIGAGLSIREISATVGKSEAAVRKQLARTLATLKDQHDA
ncbi:MAG: sigma-70 family RNA polymerase sigma factor [Sphaerobacter sp.]|nr:sigma-70 family RNA polymerase sigma factor [Sphaerobacter sp.]